MKPTQEQVIAWARDTGCLNIGDYGHKTYEFEAEGLKRLAAIAYEAGRKDENEACAEMCEEDNWSYAMADIIRKRMRYERLPR